MSISASMIVEVFPRAVAAASASLSFDCLLLTKNAKASPFERYASAESVGAVYGLDSKEKAFADAYFAADTDKTKAPNALCIARDYVEQTAAFLKSGYLPDLETLKKITAGGFTVNVNGSPVVVSSLDLHSVTSLSEAAQTIGQKITGTTGTYDAVQNCFYFTTSQKGKTASMAFAHTVSGNAEALRLTADDGAQVVAGHDAVAPNVAMEEITAISRDWVTFTSLTEESDERVLAFAKWCGSKGVNYIYLPWTVSDKATSSGGLDIASKLRDAGAQYVAPIYGTSDYAAFFAGMVSATDWGRIDGVKNYAYKRSALLPANVSKQGIAEILKSKRYNFIGNFATRSAQFQISAWGTCVGEPFAYIDQIAGMIWLANECQRVLMDGITSQNRLSYTRTGLDFVRMWMSDPIEAALNNGFIEPGLKLSAPQKTDLIARVGKDVSADVENDGFYLQVLPPAPAVRMKRGSPIVNLFFSYGGAVLKIDASVTAYF